MSWSKIAVSVVSFLAGGLLMFLLVQYSANQSTGGDGTADIGPQIKDYLIENPEVITAVFEELRRREDARVASERAEILANARDELFYDEDSFVAGDENAKVTVVEFFDYNCGFCKRAHPDVIELRETTDDIRLVYKEFPILGETSVLASRAALAAKKQDKYLVFHDALMAQKAPINEAKIMQVAAEVGLDTFQLSEDMKDPDISRIINENLELAQKLHVSGTPTFVFGDEFVPGAIGLAQMRNLVEQEKESCDIC